MEDALTRLGFGLLTGTAIAVPAVAMTLMWTSGRILNLAIGELVTLGAYVTYALWGIAPLPLVIAAAAAVPAVVACLMYAAVFRFLKGREVFVPLIASIGMAFMLNNLVIAVWGTGIERVAVPAALNASVRFGPFMATPLLLFLAAGAALVVAGVALLLYRTDFGLRARAASQHGDLAEVSGIAAFQVTLAVWALAGALAGLGGAALGISASVTPTLGATLLLIIAAAVVVGGLGSPAGAVLGALLVGVTTELSTIWVNAALKPAVAFVLMAVILLFRSGGLVRADLEPRHA